MSSSHSNRSELAQFSNIKPTEKNEMVNWEVGSESSFASSRYTSIGPSEINSTRSEERDIDFLKRQNQELKELLQKHEAEYEEMGEIGSFVFKS